MVGRRYTHREAGPGPLRTVTGLWQPPGGPSFLLMPLDTVLYVLNEHGEEEYRPYSPGFFTAGPNARGEECGAEVETADGRRLGTVFGYEHPEENPANLGPYVLLTPAAGLTGLPAFRESLPEEEFRRGPEVKILAFPEIAGNVVGPPRWEEYYSVAIRSEIQAARVRIHGVVEQPGRKIGAAVVLRSDERVLVGMVVDFQDAGRHYDALCYPAYKFAERFGQAAPKPQAGVARQNGTRDHRGTGEKVGV